MPPAELRTLRLAAGLTQAAAAALVGLGARTRWSEYESGRRPIPAHRLELFRLKTR